MGIGVSVFLIAAGAILAFAVEQTSSNGVNLETVGVILMIVGAIGLVSSLILFGPRTRRTVIEDDTAGGPRRRVVRQDY